TDARKQGIGGGDGGAGTIRTEERCVFIPITGRDFADGQGVAGNGAPSPRLPQGPRGGGGGGAAGGGARGARGGGVECLPGGGADEAELAIGRPQDDGFRVAAGGEDHGEESGECEAGRAEEY